MNNRIAWELLIGHINPVHSAGLMIPDLYRISNGEIHLLGTIDGGRKGLFQF